MANQGWSQGPWRGTMGRSIGALALSWGTPWLPVWGLWSLREACIAMTSPTFSFIIQFQEGAVSLAVREGQVGAAQQTYSDACLWASHHHTLATSSWTDNNGRNSRELVFVAEHLEFFIKNAWFLKRNSETVYFQAYIKIAAPTENKAVKSNNHSSWSVPGIRISSSKEHCYYSSHQFLSG